MSEICAAVIAAIFVVIMINVPVQPATYRIAKDLCAPNAGVSYMTVRPMFGPEVTCVNGAHFTFKDDEAAP